MKHKQTLGERVKLLREYYRLSQILFGVKVNISHVAIGNIENGITTRPQNGLRAEKVKCCQMAAIYYYNALLQCLVAIPLQIRIATCNISFANGFLTANTA